MVRLNVAPEKKNKEHNKKQGIPFNYSRHNYSNDDAVENLLEYMFNPEKMPSNCFAVHGVPYSKDIPLLAKAFRYVRRDFNQDHDRRLNHFEICLNEEETAEFGVEGLALIVRAYSLEFAKEYQLVWVIHENKPTTLHAHLLFSHISYRTGKRHRRAGKNYPQRELARLEECLEIVRSK